jgi:hypothetical protein
MRMTFSHLLHGFAGFVATIAMPWYFANPAVIRIAIVFFLSLILLGVAIVLLHRSIKAKSKQGDVSDSQLLQTLEQAIEEGRASLDLNVDLDVAASPTTHEETPSPLAELALQFDKALPEPRPDPKPTPKVDPKSEHNQIAQSPLIQSAHNGANGANHDGIAHPPPNPARPEIAHVSLPRLSELRGMRFSQALRELDKAKRSAPPNTGTYPLKGALAGRHNDAPPDMHNSALDDPTDDPISEALLSAIAPFEPMFASAASAPGLKSSATAMNTAGAQGPSQQAFFPTKPAQPDRRRSRREEKDRRSSPREPKAPGQETGGFLDELQILPSQRGQYKKKA